jgi:formate--tetrahydrofolate ligase
MEKAMVRQITRSDQIRPIEEIARELDISRNDIEFYGKYMAKIPLEKLFEATRSGKRGKLVLVTAITPTRSGEGKTTVAIGLAQALWQMEKKAVPVLRQPSLGPVFGVKGGATGGGLCEILPQEDINLHFTGDLHAVSSANNLLAALIDNHIFQGNELAIDSHSIFHRRVVDMNDRALREIVTGLGASANGEPRQTGFNITAASEILAILGLSESIVDLKNRIGKMVIGKNKSGAPVTVEDLEVTGAIAALLSHAIKPNLVQTTEGTPVLVHGGPFANIAHGCSSILSLRLALSVAEIVITEAGFGSDLGFEKYCDILAGSYSDLIPDAVMLVATVKALKLHGGETHNNLGMVNREAVFRGLHNLDSHVAIIKQTGLPFVVAINKFDEDSKDEIQVIADHCEKMGWHFAVNDTYHLGGVGGVELASKISQVLTEQSSFSRFYDAALPVTEKIETLARKIYGVERVSFSTRAVKQLAWLGKYGYNHLPVCIAKSQYSLDGSSKSGTAHGALPGVAFEINELRLSAGAGFVVALSGDILTMPGLPRRPAALDMDIDENGNVLIH